MYASNKDYIQNQFKINHDLYKGYKSEDEFIIGYPFIPYQFKLIAHVFEAFQQLKFVIKQVKDNERSILGITILQPKNTPKMKLEVLSLLMHFTTNNSTPTSQIEVPKPLRMLWNCLMYKTIPLHKEW